MHVVGHQTVRPDLHQKQGTPLRHQFDVRLIITVLEKCLLPTISALSDVVRKPRRYHSCKSRHRNKLFPCQSNVKNMYGVPGFRPDFADFGFTRIYGFKEMSQEQT